MSYFRWRYWSCRGKEQRVAPGNNRVPLGASFAISRCWYLRYSLTDSRSARQSNIRLGPLCGRGSSSIRSTSALRSSLGRKAMSPTVRFLFWHRGKLDRLNASARQDPPASQRLEEMLRLHDGELQLDESMWVVPPQSTRQKAA